MDVSIPALIIAIVSLATLAFQELRHRRDHPAQKARGEVELQQEITQAFRDANALHIEDVKAIAEGQRTIAEQARTIATGQVTVTNLIAKIDGLPKMIAELTAQQLVSAGYIQLQRQALSDAGVLLKDQPVEAEPVPLTPLTPPTLLDDLTKDKDALRIGDIVKIAPPDEPPTP